MDKKKLKFIKIFENFNKDYFDEIIRKDKTYINKKSFYKQQNSNIKDIEKYNKIVKKIRKYDINNFEISYSYVLIIKPDIGFINLIDELNSTIINEIPTNIEFEFSIFIALMNRIDFKEGIPKELRNMRLGYKLYKLIINEYNFITSKIGASEDAKNIWYFLMQDSDLLSFTSENISGVITKNLSNDEIKEHLDTLIGIEYDLIFDDDLLKKINMIYGDVNFYKTK